MKNKITLLLLAIIIYGLYVGYKDQRQTYASNLAFHLQVACSQMIKDDFQQHASQFDTRKAEDNVTIETHSKQDIFNNVLQLDVKGRSFVYFNDFAPQEVECKATILPIYKTNRKITKDTKVAFMFVGPSYLPSEYKSRIFKNPSFELTFDEIDQIAPLAGIISIEKPGFHFFGIN